jgi:putative redox protein
MLRRNKFSAYASSMRGIRAGRHNPRFGEQSAVEFSMECTVNWVAASGMAFMAETGSGHVLVMDGAPDGGGRNLAPRPMETVLAGTGGCTAYDVVLILKRGRHQVSGCQVKLSSERAATDPKVFTSIHMHFIVTGKGLPEAAVQRAIQMSHEKYCSASIMLGKMAEITTSHEIVEA